MLHKQHCAYPEQFKDNRCQETDVFQSKYYKTAAEELTLRGSHWKPSSKADTK